MDADVNWLHLKEVSFKVLKDFLKSEVNMDLCEEHGMCNMMKNTAIVVGRLLLPRMIIWVV